MYVECRKIYTMADLDEFLDATNDTITIVENKNGVKYANTGAAFDIETSSFYSGTEKAAVMYVWQFAISGIVIYGRTWEELKTLVRALEIYHNLGEERRMVVYVHNLAYEFAWIVKYFKFVDMFFKDVRKPLYLITDGGIEFRCSYALSNLSLKDCGKSLTKYKVEKKTGQLDYTKIRTPVTPLTDSEMEYCVNDVKVVCAYVQELIEQEGDILKLPYTKTGFVRNFCRNQTLYEGSEKRKKYNKSYRKLIKSLTLTPETYDFSRACFQGGFTHANIRNVGKVHKDVHSIDFTSSYPYVMCTEQYPMSTPEKVEGVTYKDLKKFDKKYRYMFEAGFTDIELKPDAPDAYISRSKCGICSPSYDEDGNLLEDVIVNNGRVEYAAYLTTKITDVDMKIIRKYYTWSDIKIRNVYKMVKDYLPRSFICAILTLYGDKTTLKGVKEQESFYQIAKGLLNSLYGMSVTNPLNDEIACDIREYDYEFQKSPCDVDKEIEKYNKSKKRFLYYLWGVWVTAFARYNLLMSVYQFGDDYIYADTDSIKFTNYDKHADFIEKYNENVKVKIHRVCDYYRLDFALFMPKTVKGEEKLIGVWDWETAKGAYKKFKTLGAKRYMYEQNGELHLTVSGIAKASGAAYFASFENPFAEFKQNAIVPAEHSGRTVSTYLDSEYSGVVIDYLGTPYEYHEKSGVHMEATTYEFNISATYINLIMNKQEVSMFK